jgi:hypothetical protein
MAAASTLVTDRAHRRSAKALVPGRAPETPWERGDEEVDVPVDIRVVTANRPGAGLHLLKALADEGISLDGFCADIRPGERWVYVHLLVDDGEKARTVLERAGLEVTASHDVDILDLENKAGTLADAVKGYTDAGRNIEVLYMASDSRIVVGTEDMQAQRHGVRMEDAKY